MITCRRATRRQCHPAQVELLKRQVFQHFGDQDGVDAVVSERHFLQIAHDGRPEFRIEVDGLHLHSPSLEDPGGQSHSQADFQY